MADLSLSVKSREVAGRKVNSLRTQGLVPGIVYGHGIKNKNIVIGERELEQIYDEAGESSLIDLTVDDAKPLKVMIKAIQREPVYDKPIHVDLRAVRMDEKITAEIDLEFVGEAPAVKELGGTLVKNFDYLEVECLPTALVSEIKVDLSQLKTFDDVIRIKDLNIPEGMKVFQDENRSIAVVTPPLTEEELAELEKVPEETVEDVEVEEKGKAEEAAEGEEKKEEPKEEKSAKGGSAPGGKEEAKKPS
ncbi:50S ribosomal protein L25 [Candidatus Saccharibacteria bacterium]|nr:50S ribosomal protein L25 [Candidatus Saccharibacteria bacterium]NIV04383.1 50S ribosomal protein L25 [Calditrichia bacterium]NIS38936.1 50S ribosomal protein L25 [Candidatus Saccharibacteria bacterium]NIV72916.1 50S ribosomal protein L25 [Calditrichia bacterium]NIW00151.1 50S ribosomal protein L25 [Candidatus Saccharibacteria bacterium]